MMVKALEQKNGQGEGQVPPNMNPNQLQNMLKSAQD